MDAISYVRILAGRWRIIALTCFIGLLAGWITTPGVGDGSGSSVFIATHTLRVETAGAVPTEGNRGQVTSDIGLTELVATGGDVSNRVAAELDVDVVALLERVTTASDPTLGTLSITARDTEAERAAQIADTFANKLLEVLTEQAQESYGIDLEDARADLAGLQAQVDELEPISPSGRVDVENSERAGLLERYEAANLRVQELEGREPSAGFTTLLEAIPQPAGAAGAADRSTTRQNESRRTDGAQDGDGAAPVQDLDTAPDRVTRMLIGGAVGLLLGIGLAILRERLDPRIRTREDAERAFGLPVLAEVPHLEREHRHRPEIATVDNGRALEAEAYRVLATSLLFQHSSSLAGDRAGIHNGHRDDHEPPRLIETSDDVRRATNGLPLLGRVPVPATGTVLSHRLQPSSRALEAYRWLGIPLGRADQNGPARLLLVTSATAGEETTATAANLGVALARDGQRVVVIDGDLRQPRLHTFFDLPDTVGLTSVVSGEVSLSVASQSVPGEDGLSIVAAGPLPADPHELLISSRVGEVLAALAGTVDVVILKAAPVLTTEAPSALAGEVDGTVLVATGGITSGADLRRTVDTLERVGATLLGVVLNEPPRNTHPKGHNGSGPAPAATSDGSVILITSPGAKEGKSSASVNLSAALAEAGKAVLALDFDLRRPRLHQFFGEEAHQRGLTDALALTGRGPRLEDVIRPTSVHEVRVALSGTAVTNPSELLPGARHLIAEAQGLAEVVVIDTPPALVASDAVQLIPAADVVVVVCRTGTTRSTEAARARQLLARLDAPVLGLVLLGVQPSSGARSYYYYDQDRRHHFWSRSRSRHAQPGPTRRNNGGRPARQPEGTVTGTAATGSGAKVQPKAKATKAGSKVTRAADKAPRGKKAKQRSSK